jgi:hypothetical protein
MEPLQSLPQTVIREINYVTVNGLVLTEGVHYVLGADKGTVRISNSGAPVRKNPSLTTTVLVATMQDLLKQTL